MSGARGSLWILDSSLSVRFSTSWRRWEELKVFKRNYLRSIMWPQEDSDGGFAKEEDFEDDLRSTIRVLKNTALEVKWKVLSQKPKIFLIR